MLQQTQVASMLGHYARFTESLPTVEALANAKEQQVLSLWSGLGYYSRARNLHRGAKYIVEERRGIFPKTREEWLEVPGVGPYTAGAVSSIAFNERAPIVDGNVTRVFTRFYANGADPKLGETQRWLWKKADDWVQACDSPRVLNQAIMELGALLCTRSSPKCSRCPISKDCVGFRSDSVERYPKPKTRRKNVDLHWKFLILEKQGKIFLIPSQATRKPSENWWRGLWVLPQAVDAAVRVDEILGTLPEVRHTVTHHRLHIETDVVEGRPQTPRLGKWWDPSSRLPISGLTRKVIEKHREQTQLPLRGL